MLYLKRVFSNFYLFQVYLKVKPVVKLCHRSNMSEQIKPPEAVRGKTVLEKEAFQTEIEIPFVCLDKGKLSKVLAYIKKYCLKLENLKPVQHLNENVEIYLNPYLIKNFSSFSSDVQSLLKDDKIEENIKMKKIIVGYQNFTHEAILRAVLPLDKEGM